MSSSGLFLPAGDLPEKPLRICLYGKAKIGKTYMLLQASAQHGIPLYLLSLDKGDTYMRQHREEFPRVMVTYPETFGEVKDAISYCFSKAEKLVGKFGPNGVIVALDTASHLQSMLMQQQGAAAKSRKVSVGRDTVELTTQADWGVNLQLMTQVMLLLRDLPCLVVVTALEKSDSGGDKPAACPAISGQSYHRVLGDCDAIVRLTIKGAGNRILQCHPTTAWEGGDRTGRLSGREPADFHALVAKMIAAEPTAE